MKVLVVNFSDVSGGAARAAHRLHTALKKIGLDSEMLVQDKNINHTDIHGKTSLIHKILKTIRRRLDRRPLKRYPKRSTTPFSAAWLAGSGTAQRINQLNPDIVHLHWICNGMMSVEEIRDIKAPIVWSLHDMWALTGGCHYDEHCGKYTSGCGACPVLGSEDNHDLSYYVFQRKLKTYPKASHLTLVGLSGWLAKCARNSLLTRRFSVKNIPNPINTSLFKPLDQKHLREELGLPKDKKLVLFGAMDATSDPRKGFKPLKEALNLLDRNDIELVVFGGTQEKEAGVFRHKTHYLGNISDDQKLIDLYNCADVMIVPSLQENLSNAIMESISCGTPVVAFNTGGNGDMIKHQHNGYLASAFDITDLSHGVEWVLSYPNQAHIRQNAREMAVSCFDETLVAERYKQLYASILEERGVKVEH